MRIIDKIKKWYNYNRFPAIDCDCNAVFRKLKHTKDCKSVKPKPPTKTMKRKCEFRNCVHQYKGECTVHKAKYKDCPFKNYKSKEESKSE